MILSFREKFRYPYTNIKTERKPLETAPIPNFVKIPLISAKIKIGIPLVKVGDKVVEGDPIGQSGDFFFYASISGIVRSIQNEERRIDTVKILTVPTIEIEFIGKIINWEKKRYDYLNSSTDELKAQIIRLGVENLNPTSCLSIEEILNFPPDSHLIVTALEFSPMVNFNEELLLQKTEEIHSALSILEYIIKPKQSTIVVSVGLKNEYKHPQKEVLYSETTHPNGFEARILEYFTGLDQINLDIMKHKKHIVVDIQTLFCIHNAIVLKKPFIEQLVTIDGKVAKNAAHYFVRIGMNIQALLTDTGIYDTPKKTISGNIFNADIIYNLAKHITPSIYSLLLLDEEPTQYNRFDNCIQCNLCHTSCPVNLFPYDLAHESINNPDIQKCIDCGICSYVCPASIPLGYFLELKKEGQYE